MSSISTINSPELTKQTEPLTVQQPSYWTRAKVERVALGVLAALVFAGAIVTAVLTPSPFCYLAIPLALISLALIAVASQIKDYDDAEELAVYRQQASSMTFHELYNTFPLDKISQYEIVPLVELRKKFNRQVQTMDFLSVASFYPIGQLLEKGIASQEHVAILRRLEREAAQSRAQFNATATQIDLRHQDRSEVLKQHIRAVKRTTDLSAFSATQGKFLEKARAYEISKAITTPVAFAGSLVADYAGRESQASYEDQMARVRGQHQVNLNHLEGQYAQYKQTLEI